MFGKYVNELSNINIKQWHEESKARSDSDAEVAAAKRIIDILNQKRNDLIEKIDELFAKKNINI